MTRSAGRPETPCVILDLERLAANIARVQAIADERGLGLRPHVKTHKSLRIAGLQLEAGASGLTASKADEALVFLQGGAPGLTCAYPVLDPAKLERLLSKAQEQGADLRLMVDSRAGVKAAARAAESVGLAPAVFIKIDVGLHRCGLEPEHPDLAPLARLVREQGLPLLGILSHAGQAYGAADQAGARDVARLECALMARARERLEKAGLAVAEVSVGSTPTVLASDCFEGITEIRPGNYVFLDRAALRLGLARPEDVALTVLATVVSRNRDYLIVDAGSKVLSSDGGAHGTAQAGYGLAWLEQGFGDPDAAPMVVDKLSEEHGWLPTPAQGPRPDLGDRVRIIPNHACAVANLADSFTVVHGDGPPEIWPVDARGRVL